MTTGRFTHTGRRRRSAFFAPLFAGAVAFAAAAPAPAQYPERPLRFIIPQAAGSASDVSARIVAAELIKVLGQQIVVDNRPGGGLTIGIDMVVRAAPDGYTIGYGNIGGLAINRAMMPKVPYDSTKDVQPIAQIHSGNMMLAVAPSLPVKSVRELLDYARGNPGKLSNASSGSGTPGHLAGELFKDMAKLQIVHVPYKGGAAAMTEMMAGRVHLIFESMSSITPHHKAGRLRGIAVSGPKRSPGYDELPTIAEAGVPGYDVTVWAGIITPVGVPKPIIARLNQAMNQAFAEPRIRETFYANGLELIGGTPEAYGALIKREVEKYAMLAKRIGAKVD